jgi:hypothetical protein
MRSAFRIALFSVVAAAGCWTGEGNHAAAAGVESPSSAAANGAKTPPWNEGLSDRELAVGRWFSQLTFLQDRAQDPWPVWHRDPKELGVGSLRYQLAFAGYGCTAMAAKTPAYRELIGRQLRDLCERMLDVRVWFYCTSYWKYGDQPPDPCRYENVMYTGHLTQLMCLYELMTGDARYSDSGWDFVWRDGRKTHYDLKTAIERMHVQSVKATHGGVCCEPGLVFATCNAHSAASFVLHDMLHGTHYADANAKWFAWMAKNFRLKKPDARDCFYLVYHQATGFFTPASDIGADCWTLGWGHPWFPSADYTRQCWDHLRAQGTWRQPTPDTLYAQNNEIISCCGGGTLLVSNAFVPLVAVQVEGRRSATSQKLFRWLETKCGQAIDADGDGYSESYGYKTDPAMSIATTGVIATALATDRDSMRTLYRTPRKQLRAEPTLAHADYPNVYVRAAEYRAPILRFVVLKGMPKFSGKTELVCSQCPGKAVVTRDGRPYADFTQTGSNIVIRSDVDREHVFEVAISAGASRGESARKQDAASNAAPAKDDEP